MPSWRFRHGEWRVGGYLYRVQDQMGVNSQVGPDAHALLWDFDNIALDQVVASLVSVLRFYDLPQIRVVAGSAPGRYHAYCLARKTWIETVRILAATEGICWRFFRFGVARGKFTLRVTGKNNQFPRTLIRIPSAKSETVMLDELSSFVRYESWH